MAWKLDCKTRVSCADYEKVLKTRGGFLDPSRAIFGLVKGVTYALPLFNLANRSYKRKTFKKDVKTLHKQVLRRNRKSIKGGARIRPQQTRNGLQRG